MDFRLSNLDFLARALRTASLVLLLASRAPGQGQNAAPDSLMTQADQTFAQMSRITGLPIKGPLRKKVVDRSQIEALLKAKLRSEETPQETAAEEASLKAFGLVPPEFNLEKFLTAFYTEQAAGFYDPETKTMYIAGWVAPDIQKMVLAHELTHALQDQSFHLEQFLRAVEKNDDESNARQAVVEGHATAAMMQSLMGPVPLARMPSLKSFMATAINQNPGQYPVFAKAPFFLRYESLFPYSQGLEFIQQGLKLGGWQQLDRLFRDPPVNTKEIYDPEFYFDHKPQHAIFLPPSPRFFAASGLHFAADNTLGELGYHALLGQWLSEGEAEKLGPEWIADRYRIFASRQPNTFALVSRAQWISPAVATEFYQDYQQVLAKKYANLKRNGRSRANLFVASTVHGWVVLEEQGNECLWAEGIPKADVGPTVKWLRGFSQQ
jgi:hypothetical protein